MTRANKITVKVDGDNLVATFKKTHKDIMDIHSESTDWQPNTAMTKTGQREAFRIWVIEHAADYEINYQPMDMRDPSQVRKAHYTTDEDLLEDVSMAITGDLKKMVVENKHNVEWGGVNAEDIIPMTHTGKGTPLESLGIEDGKYKNNGNWAWATINCTVIIKYKGEEIYILIKVQLVSGQIKKPKITKTEFNKMVEDELIAAGLATSEELNPPKEDKKTAKEEVTEDKQHTVFKTEDEINKIRKRADLMKYAESIGYPITENTEDTKMKDLKDEIIKFQTEQIA